MKSLVLVLLSGLLFISCNDVKERTKDTLNEGGRVVGETASEIADGLKDGIKNTLDSKIELSDTLQSKGISIGKYYTESDIETNNDNKLVIYIITEQDFKAPLTFKLTDKKGVEYGRKQIEVEGKAGEANYYDVVFDARTDIESKSTIEIN
ncbi:hypothetical protein GCM10007424_04190 [Flavobacterium suaedae]|uniref:Uncharacterized protein n=1 Tax=Flavobacterium suaedae TaxID=1767027 RepID=A0ABQ1JF44_9FLAO|nr:hypothetical protein [Flavobacterium suaedae]GGB67352.1 hypothetical protein GCM10007424_04190 [Flavobacterium suaedae]